MGRGAVAGPLSLLGPPHSSEVGPLDGIALIHSFCLTINFSP